STPWRPWSTVTTPRGWRCPPSRSSNVKPWCNRSWESPAAPSSANAPRSPSPPASQRWSCPAGEPGLARGQLAPGELPGVLALVLLGAVVVTAGRYVCRLHRFLVGGLVRFGVEGRIPGVSAARARTVTADHGQSGGTTTMNEHGTSGHRAPARDVPLPRFHH